MATQAKKAPRVATVRGVQVNKVDKELLAKKLEELGVKVPPKADAAAMLECYLDWTVDFLKGRDPVYGQCEACEAPCDPDDPAARCPVCGAPYEEEQGGGAKEVVVQGEAAPEVGSAELDATVSRIRAAHADSMHGAFRVGKELLAVHEVRSYKSRLGGDGKPKYKSWEQFVEAECPFSANYARTLVGVVRRFTEEQVQRLGVEKLRMIARAPAARQPALLKRAPSATTRELKSEVRGGHSRGATPGDAGEAARRKGTEAAAQVRRKAAAEGKAVTVAFQLGKYDLPLRPTEGGFVAVEESDNGVTTTYTVKTTGRRRVMTIERKR